MDAPVLISTSQNIYYVTGFYTTARRPGQIGCNCVLMTKEKTYFFFPAGWEPLVAEQLADSDVDLVPCRGKVPELAERIFEILKKITGTATLGYEKDGMELELFLTIQEKFSSMGRQIRWTDVSGILKSCRLIKSEKEIQLLRESASVATAAMEYAKTIIEPGKREMDIVAELEYFMRKEGSEGVPFTMKVLTGENAVRTINLPGKRVIQEGEIVLLDFGATVQNYASDWTRSFAVRRASKEQQELYNLVWKIERTCIQKIRPGVSCSDLMSAAMSVLKGHPYADGFNPYLGHSIGITSQEWPPIVPDTIQTLQENMVITIEPGVYIPGIGGVRMEDEVLVTASGYEILTGLKEETFILKNRD